MKDYKNTVGEKSYYLTIAERQGVEVVTEKEIVDSIWEWRRSNLNQLKKYL